VVKFVYDILQPGDPELRQWVLSNAKLLIFQSPLSKSQFPYAFTAPSVIMPPNLDYKRFEQARILPMSLRDRPREGAIWYGRMFPGKGVAEAVQWANVNKIHVDFYGFGPDKGQIVGEYAHYCGEVLYQEAPALLARYEKFLFLPTSVDSFSRTTVEAWYAGCALIVNGNVGGVYWMQNDPSAIEHGADLFWQAIERVKNGS
jgi:hypothetical protein